MISLKTLKLYKVHQVIKDTDNIQDHKGHIRDLIQVHKDHIQDRKGHIQDHKDHIHLNKDIHHKDILRKDQISLHKVILLNKVILHNQAFHHIKDFLHMEDSDHITVLMDLILIWVIQEIKDMAHNKEYILQAIIMVQDLNSRDMLNNHHKLILLKQDILLNKV